MNDAIRRIRRAPKALKVVQAAPVGLDTGLAQSARRVVRAGKSDHLMAVRDQVPSDGAANESRRAGNKYTHADRS